MSARSGHLVELKRLVEGANLAGFLKETARFYASRLALADPEGEVVTRWNDPDGVLDAESATASRTVDAYGVSMGRVLTLPVRAGEEAAAAGLADHIAKLLTEFAMKEYELNDLSREILDSYEEVNLFYDISSALGAVRDVEGVCAVILEKACEIIRVSRASILLVDQGAGEMFVAAAKGIPEDQRVGIRIPVGEGISGKVLESRTPQLVDDVRNLPSGLLKGYERYVTRSFISVPLVVDRGAGPEVALSAASGPGFAPRTSGRPIGVINMTDRVDRTNFSSGDLKLLSALASQAAVLIENMRLIELEKELRIARDIQRSLLPDQPPVIPGLDLAGACVPARNVGGDYYDFLVREENGHLAAVIADVSGHNVASAIMMAVVRSALRGEIRRFGDPGRILERLNSFLYEDLTRAELFLSLFCVVYEPGSRKIRFANAGHNPALLHRPAEGGCRALDADGLLTGVMEEMTYPEEEETLRPGDTVLLYTDGLVEATDPSGIMFGMERLAAALERSGRLPAGPLLDVLFEEVYAFSGEKNQADDMTAVVLKVEDPGLR